MRRINLSYFMDVGVRVDALARWDITTATPDAFKSTATMAREYLHVLIQPGLNPMQIPATVSEASNLLRMIDEAIQKDPVDPTDIMNVWLQASKVQTLLHGELAVQAIYHIWPKRAYDTNLLVSRAIAVFPEWIAHELTNTERHDIDQAGKCLALEIPTAAAFHLMRLTKSVLRRYYELVVGSAPKLKMRNWGAYIKTLRSCGASDKVLFAINEIKDIYRNPVMHPEEMYSLDDAISLMGIVETAISTMHTDMVQRKAAATPLIGTALTRAIAGSRS